MSILWTDVKTFFINQSEVTKIQLNGTTIWQKSSGPTPPTPGPDYTEPFYIEDISNTSFDISFIKNNVNAPTLLIEYSTDKSNWSVLGNTSTTALSVQVPANSKMYFRCNTNKWGTKFYYNKIISNDTFFSVGGNIMSLLYGSNFTGQETTFPTSDMYVFNNLFNSSYYLNNASDLILPATTLNSYCYQYMFYGCTSLTTAPALPATTLENYSYANMFYNCSSLNYIKCLATNISANNCTFNWVSGVSNSGTFVKDASMNNWSTGNNGVPSGWTVQDAS